MRKARDLVRSNPRDLAASHPQFAQEVERELKETERQASLNARLPAILGGKLKPTDASETVGLAQLCYDKRLYGASARFWAEAFQAGPKLAEDMKAQNSYNAACAAAQAGGGQGKDEPPLEETARAGWRKRAIDWLKADLAFWTKQVETGPPQARALVVQTLQHWKVDSDLAGIRDEASLAKLPENERKACQALWTEVEALLKKTQSP